MEKHKTFKASQTYDISTNLAASAPIYVVFAGAKPASLISR
ncbi:MAG: hypothetical protein ACI9T7_003747 [Oleiphilaceae bacterium]|jgi:hypothetical protein